ncbi:unnamed protein product [Dovyalis caffra]|uniref:Uncharacterized protein n=1 Tax=Dovyalis caffra TaxID=77055 RepID=A0AAV1SE12_9ROSI|nr:unnamed protein product [Dovyalis caffra]
MLKRNKKETRNYGLSNGKRGIRFSGLGHVTFKLLSKVDEATTREVTGHFECEEEIDRVNDRLWAGLGITNCVDVVGTYRGPSGCWVVGLYKDVRGGGLLDEAIRREIGVMSAIVLGEGDDDMVVAATRVHITSSSNMNIHGDTRSCWGRGMHE